MEAHGNFVKTAILSGLKDYAQGKTVTSYRVTLLSRLPTSTNKDLPGPKSTPSDKCQAVCMLI